MVSETVLRALDRACQFAADRRNQCQSDFNRLREALATANANLESSQSEEQNVSAHNQSALNQIRELNDYYNGIIDKSGLQAIQAEINRLSAQQIEIHRELGQAREQRMQPTVS